MIGGQAKGEEGEGEEGEVEGKAGGEEELAQYGCHMRLSRQRSSTYV